MVVDSSMLATPTPGWCPMRRFRLLLVPAVLALGSLSGGRETPDDVVAKKPAREAGAVPTPPSGAVAVVGALIKTQTDAGDFVGTIVIDGGTVTALGKDVQVPAGARKIDAAGHVVTPGLIDA